MSGRPLGTRAELIERLRSHARANSRRAIISFLALIVWGVGGLWVALKFYPGGRPVPIILELAWFATFFGISFMTPRWNSWYLRKVGLACPYCRNPLLTYSAQVVVSSGRCGRCGEAVLTDA